MTTTTSTPADHLDEYNQLVAEFDEAASHPDWPGHRVLNNEGTEILANHVDEIELPAWADIDDDLDQLVAGWADSGESTQEATSSPQKADQEQDEHKVEQAVVVGYRAAHARVKAAKGKASEQTCIDCGEQAREWSYDHGDPDQHIADDPVRAGMAYSLDVNRYQPRCRACHVALDKAEAKRRNRAPGQPAEGWTARRWPPEAQWDVRRTLRQMGGLDDQPLDDVLDLMTMHFTVQDPDDLATVVAWVAGTHLTARGVGQAMPRLAVIAPTKGSGKSKLLEVIQRLTHNGIPIQNTVSDALLPRMMQTLDQPTLCIDEADKTIKPTNTNMMAVLNAGWERGGTAWLNMKHGDDWRPEAVDVFAPIAMAGIGVNVAEDTDDRIITIRMHRNPDAPRPPDWRGDMKEVDDRLRQRLAAWADRVADLPHVRKPPMPPHIGSRDRDRWEVLAAVAEGTHRADWREAIRDRQEVDYQSREAHRAEAGRSPEEQLVVDIHDALRGSTADAWSTDSIVNALQAHAPDRHGSLANQPISRERLGWSLRKFWGEHSNKVIIDGQRRRGFTRTQLTRLWEQAGASALHSTEAEA